MQPRQFPLPAGTSVNVADTVPVQFLVSLKRPLMVYLSSQPAPPADSVHVRLKSPSGSSRGEGPVGEQFRPPPDAIMTELPSLKVIDDMLIETTPKKHEYEGAGVTAYVPL